MAHVRKVFKKPLSLREREEKDPERNPCGLKVMTPTDLRELAGFVPAAIIVH